MASDPEAAISNRDPRPSYLLSKGTNPRNVVPPCVVVSNSRQNPQPWLPQKLYNSLFTAPVPQPRKHVIASNGGTTTSNVSSSQSPNSPPAQTSSHHDYYNLAAPPITNSRRWFDVHKGWVNKIKATDCPACTIITHTSGSNMVSSAQYCCSQSVPDLGNCNKGENGAKSVFLNGDTNGGINTGKRFGSAKPRKYHYSGRRGNDIINNRVGEGSDTGETLSSFGSTFSPKLNLRNKFSRLSLKERSTIGANNLGGKKNLSYVGLEPTTSSSPSFEESGALATTAPPSSAFQHQSFMPRINFRRKTTRRSSSADDVNAADPPALAGAPFSVKSYALVGETLITTPKTATPTPNATTALREFSHLDVNSILASLEYERSRSVGGTSPPHRYSGALGCRNVRTGASAALEESGSDPHGDGRGNELVQSCPYFRAELGGEAVRHPQLDGHTPSTLHPLTSLVSAPDSTLRDPRCAGLDVLDISKRATLQLDQTTLVGCNESYVIENVDAGAHFYRVYFLGQEHSNYFGIDPTFGPVAISLARRCCSPSTTLPTAGDNNLAYYYNLIIRTSQLISLKGSLCEEVIPSSSKHGNPLKGLPARDILEYLVPSLSINCLRLADSTSPVIEKRLLSVDEQQVKKNYKVGILYCKAGQTTEEEMYNNEKAGSAFTEFLALLGDTITLKGFDKYKAELDTKSDTTGTKSVYTAFGGHQIMFHISTMLPFTPNNKQQISRKRHIGNDVVTIVFQEPGSLAFSPKNVRSHYQHVFVIVRPTGSISSKTIKYKVAVTRSKDVEPFGPPLPRDGTFDSLQRLRDFILTKCINADNAVQKSEKFATMSIRARYENLKDLAINYVTQLPLEPAYSSGNLLSKISLGSSKKRERLALSQTPFKTTTGGAYWRLGFHDFGRAIDITTACLAISAQIVCLLELNFNHSPAYDHGKVIFQTPTCSVLGWKVAGNNLRIYYDEGAYVQLLGSDDCQPLGEIMERLRQVTNGYEVIENTFYKPNTGCQLGFLVEIDGHVTDVEVGSLAWQAGLRPGSRILEVCNKAVVSLQPAQIYELLKNSTFVSILALPADQSGALIKSCGKQECPTQSLHQASTSRTSHNKYINFSSNFNCKISSPTPKRTSVYSTITTSSSCTLNSSATSSHHSTSPLPLEYMKCPTPNQYASQLSPVSQRIANTIFGSGPPVLTQTRTLVQGPTTLAPLKLNSDLSNFSKVADLNYCKIINDAKLRSLTGESLCSTSASNSSPHKRSLPAASQNTSKSWVGHRNSCSAPSYYTYPNASLAVCSGLLGSAIHARHNSLLTTTSPREQLSNTRGSCSTNTELERHLRKLIMFEDEEEDVKLLSDDDTHPKASHRSEQAKSNPSTLTPQFDPESEEWNSLVEVTSKTLQMCQPEDFESSDTVSSWCSMNDHNDVESQNSLGKISGQPTQSSNQIITQLKARCQKLEAKCNEESRERKRLQERIKFLRGENEKLKQELSVWRTNWLSSPLPHNNAQHH